MFVKSQNETKHTYETKTKVKVTSRVGEVKCLLSIIIKKNLYDIYT